MAVRIFVTLAVIFAALFCCAAACTPRVADVLVDDFSVLPRNLLAPGSGYTGDDGSMRVFAARTDAAVGRYLAFAPELELPGAFSYWYSSVPTEAAALLPLDDVNGGVLAFEYRRAPGTGANAPAFWTQLRVTGTNGTDEHYAAFTWLYYDAAAADANGWTTIRIPLAHFGLPLGRALRSITFSNFGGSDLASASREYWARRLRIEYNECPRRLAIVPPQTCSGDPLVVADFADRALFAESRNSLPNPGYTSDDGTLALYQYLSDLVPLGPGILLQSGRSGGTNASVDGVWYTILANTAGTPCMNLEPFTHLRLRVAATAGARFQVALQLVADHCAGPVRRIHTIASDDYATFTGVDKLVTIDIPVTWPARLKVRALVIYGIENAAAVSQPPPQLPPAQLLVRDISLVRNCTILKWSFASRVDPPIMDSCGPSKERVMAITFDGPDATNTPAMLDALSTYNIKATFLISPGEFLGDPAVFPDPLPWCPLVQRILREGHAIGDHTFNHPRFSTLTDEQVADQMQRSRVFFQTCLGYVPTVFRPAFGELLPHQARSIANLNQSIVLWNVESLDHLTDANPLANILTSLTTHQAMHGTYPSSAIVLMHDAFSGTNLGPILSGLVALNYTFITLDDCRERCIQRDYAGQPAWLADHTACTDPRNPSDYYRSLLLNGQPWLKGLPAVSWLSTPTATATPVPTTATPTTPVPTTATPTTPVPTTARPTTPVPTTARPTTPVPTTPRPTTPVPTTARPTTPVPTTARPTTPVPTTPRPTTPRPTTPVPTTARPTTPVPTTARPTTPVPQTAKPTTAKPRRPRSGN